MIILRSPMSGLLLGAIVLWTPSANGFSPEDYNVAARPSPVPNIPVGPSMVTACDERGDDLWNQWLQGKVPKNQATIDKAQEVKTDCPQLAGSMDRISNEIKGHQQKQASAKDHVKKSGEKYQNSVYDPAGMPCSGRACN